MSVQISDNLDYKGSKPNFARDSFATMALMKAVDDSFMDDGHVSYCAETGERYMWKLANSVDATTGRWRQIFNGSKMFINVNDVNNHPAVYASKAEARAAVPASSQAPGVIITYLLAAGWVMEQFKGTTWSTEDANWKLTGQVVSVTRSVTTGTKLATITVDGVDYEINLGFDLSKVVLSDGYYKELHVGNADVADELSGSDVRVTSVGTYLIRSTAGDESVQSSEPVQLLDIKGGCDAQLHGFAITGFQWNKFNQLNPANYITGTISGSSVASGSNKIAYIRCPLCEFTAMYQAITNNGYLLTDNAGQKVTPVAVAKCDTIPSVGATVAAVNTHTESGYTFYLPTEGYFLIEFASDADLAAICAHLAWSKDYDKFAAFAAPDTVNLAAAATAIHASGQLYGLVKNGQLIADEIQVVPGAPANSMWYRRNEYTLLSALTWQREVMVVTEGEEEVTYYRYYATLATMELDGAYSTTYADLVVEDNVLSVTSTTITTLEDFLSAITGHGLVYELAAKVSSKITISTDGKFCDDMSTEEVLGATYNVGTITTSYVRGLKDYVRSLPNTIDHINAEQEIDVFLQAPFCVGKWLENAALASTSELDNTDALQVYGNADWATDWRPFLIDMTAVEGETFKRPTAELNRINWLRDIYDEFSPAVAITQTMYDECMANDLYSDEECTVVYCTSGNFNAKTFYASCTVITVDGVKQLNMPKLYKLVDSVGVEVSHYLMPWETVDTKWSIFVGRHDDVFLMDGVIGASGKEWNGIFAAPQNYWDGVDMTTYKLVQTAISPAPVTAISENSLTKLRCFFFNYVSGITSCKGTAGTLTNSNLFVNNGTYAMNSLSMVNNTVYAWNNNYNVNSPLPVAEGGYHARNTFLTCMEVAYGTKYLCKNTRFSSGISANDACNSEATWLLNGGARCKLHSADTWTYVGWSGNPPMYKNASGGRDNLTASLSDYGTKTKCLEAQIAMSYAVEIGVLPNEKFLFNGNVWFYNSISEIANVKQIADGHMNCRIYKLIQSTFNAYDSSGDEQSFDVEVLLRTGLMEGCDMAGDIAVSWGGGCELIGLCTIDPSVSRYNNLSLAYLEPDQSQWVKDATVTNALNTKFAAESKYKFLGQVADGNNNYVRRHLPFHPAAKTMGSSSLAYGESFYEYGYNYWGALNQRVRRMVRFGAHSASSVLSARYLDAYNSASYTDTDFEGSAQVVIKTK